MTRYRCAPAFLICAALLLVVGCSDTQSAADKAASDSGAESTAAAAVAEPAQRDATIDEFLSCIDALNRPLEIPPTGRALAARSLGGVPASFLTTGGLRESGTVAEADAEFKGPYDIPSVGVQWIWFADSAGDVDAAA